MRISFNTINIYPQGFKKIKNYSQKSPKRDVFQTNPISFQAMRCSEKNFGIKRIENLHCPVCGLVMLDDEEQKKFVDDVAEKKGEALKAALEKYEDESIFVKDEENNRHRTIYRPQKQQIVDILKKLAVENPNLSLSGLVELQAKPCLEKLIKRQLVIIDEIEKYIKSGVISEQESNALNAILQEHKSRALGTSETRFQRKPFIHDLQAAAQNPEVEAKLIELSSQIPTSNTAIDAFFVKYSDGEYTNREIASKLVYQSTPSTEHLIPKSRQGANKTDNYICDCEECNSSRSNTLFHEWMEGYPNMQQELQQYLAAVQKALDVGELDPKYDGYIEEIIATIERISHGKIKLAIPESINDEKRMQIFAKRKAEIEKISKKMGEIVGRIISLRKEIAALEKDPQFDNISQYCIVCAQIDDISQKIKQTKEKLQAAELDKQRAQDALDEIAEVESKLQSGEMMSSLQTKLRIQEINQTLQTETLKDAQSRILALRETLSTLEDQMERLKDKEGILKNYIKPDTISDYSFNQLNSTINNTQMILMQIQNIQDSISDETMLRQRLEDISQENSALEAENRAILDRNGANPDDNSSYTQYLHYASLFDTSVEIAQYLSRKTTGFENEDINEIINFAQEKIRQKAIELFERDDVKYFANIDLMEQYKQEATAIKTRLEEIDEISIELQKMEEKLKTISDGKSIEQLQEMFSQLSAKRELHDKIKNISSLRNELQNLQETLSYNRKILKALKSKYRAMTSEEFKSLTSLIYY